MDLIKIDFRAGTHGHFLEYVSNVYIMQRAPSKTEIFSNTGGSHTPDDHYKNNRAIICGHFSEEEDKLKIERNDTVIQITFDRSNDEMFFIMYCNLLYRAADLGLEFQLTKIPDDIKQDKVAYRNQFFSKFNERHIYSDYFKHYEIIANSNFEFPFDAFYSFPIFCKNLLALANFLNQTFFPDSSLYQLWCLFIEKNQGLNSFNRCNTIIDNIFANRSIEIPELTILEEGWLNYKFNKMCNIYHGPMFDNERYPTNTEDIYNTIQQHLEKLRYE